MLPSDPARVASPSPLANNRSQRRYSKATQRVCLLLIFVIGAGAWLATRALIVKSDLEDSQVLVGQLQSEAKDFNLKAVAQTTSALSQRTASAAGGTHDPLWRLAEFIPGLGSNLSAVRAVAESTNDVVQQVAVPAVDMVNSAVAGPDGFDLRPLTKATTILASANTVFDTSLRKLGSVDTQKTVGPVAAAVTKLDGLFVKAQGATKTVAPLLRIASSALGQDKPRNYLLAFQNNAESTALGGSAASFTLMNVDKGVIKVAGQAGSGDFHGRAVDVNVDQSALRLYGRYLVSHLNTSTSRPDFPTAAAIMHAFWLRDQGTAVDGVVSVDPLALAMVLKATGPIPLKSGDVLSSDNAVSLLVNEIYFRFDSYAQPKKADAFFHGAASAVLKKVTGGDFDIKAMIKAIGDGIDSGSIMAWSAKPAEQALLDGTRIQGVLPTSNAEHTIIGAYYRDTSASKIDYYLDTSTHTTSDVCTAPKNPTFTTSVTLQSTLTAEQAKGLPAYVNSFHWGAKKSRTQIFVYGPVGAALTRAKVDVHGIKTVVTRKIDDLGRPVAAFTAFLAPGEKTTVTATFTGAPGSYGPLEIRGTPMINPTKNSFAQPACG